MLSKLLKNTADDDTTPSVTLLLVPAPVFTVTLRSPVTASGVITNVAVRAVPLETTTEVAVTPVPLTVTVVAPEMKLAPVKVTGTLAP